MRTLSGRPIELWVEPRHGRAAVNPVMRALLDQLGESGVVVSIRVPELEVIDPMGPAHGQPRALVPLKTATALALSLAIADEQIGVAFLNSAAATVRAHDKAATIARLAAVGLPVPRTFLCARTAKTLPALLDQPGAWVTKPTRGIHGRGIQVHSRFPSDFWEPALPENPNSSVLDDGTLLVQQRVGADEEAVKVYVAGDRCFAGIKPFSPGSYARDEIQPRELTSAESELVHAVGEALALQCFGGDLRYAADRPVIIDANPFPGYRGFPDAVPALRQEIARALEAANR